MFLLTGTVIAYDAGDVEMRKLIARDQVYDLVEDARDVPAL